MAFSFFFRFPLYFSLCSFRKSTGAQLTPDQAEETASDLHSEPIAFTVMDLSESESD